MLKKYQIFVGATYNDLMEERSAAINQIIKQRHIPSGMENFGAMGEKQWNYIKKEIDNSDYYMLIIGGRYGSINEYGISYTEMEFDYAYNRGIRIIPFLIKDMDTILIGKCEPTEEGREKLTKFRRKVEEKAGLVDYWTNKNDLQLKIANSLANVLREYPAETGWIRIDKDTNVAGFFNNELENSCTSVKETDTEYLFPALKDKILKKTQVNYDVNDPSRAVVICGDSYVQLETRDGRIEQNMVDTCLEFIKLLNDRNEFLSKDEMFCLRSLWFNSISPEVIVYIDYLYNSFNTPEYSVEEVKQMFYDGEVLGDGICYGIWVRKNPILMHSDHFDKNNKEFYEKTNWESYLQIYWEDAKFQYRDDAKRVITTTVKINNTYSYALEFKIKAEFKTLGDENFPGISFLESIWAQNDEGGDTFTLDGHESALFNLSFVKSDQMEYKREKPFQLIIHVKDNSPDYE